MEKETNANCNDEWTEQKIYKLNTKNQMQMLNIKSDFYLPRSICLLRFNVQAHCSAQCHH